MAHNTPHYDAPQSATILMKMALDGLTQEEAEAEVYKAEANPTHRLMPAQTSDPPQITDTALPQDFTDFI